MHAHDRRWHPERRRAYPPPLRLPDIITGTQRIESRINWHVYAAVLEARGLETWPVGWPLVLPARTHPVPRPLPRLRLAGGRRQ